MQPQTPPGEPSSLPPIKPPPTGGKGGAGLILGAVALALALVAVGVAFVVPGPTGPTGSSSAGAPSVTYWAVVDASGTLDRGSGASTASHVGTGSYLVTFLDILYGCTYSAVIGTATATNPPNGTVSVSAVPSDVYEVKVLTTNASKGAIDDPFYVAASCPGGLSAVVAANGTFVSGAGVTSVATELCAGDHPGCYQVIFNQDVSACAYIAGLGESFTGTPPAGSIAVAPRASVPDGVWVQAWNAAGVDTNESFHLSVYC